jgi:hypothetical protein
MQNTPINQTANVDDEGLFPQSVYNNLPTLLKNSCAVFNDRHEKDIFLLGALTVIGGAFHNLYAYNDVDKKRVAANLFSFIVAPPASGKGALNYSKKIVAKIVESFAALNKTLGSKETGKLSIPGNISSAGLIKLLQQNKGAGIIVESEIDTLVNVMKQDWGNYSDILRSAFENESTSLYRKTEKEHIEVESVKLSLAVSGTPNQFKSLMGSTENGLFSRGCYYVFDNPSHQLACFGRMKQVAAKDLDDLFADFAEIADTYYNAHLKYDRIEVIFSESQLNEIQTALQAEYNRISKFGELSSNIKRSFVIAMKVATILTFLAECETGSVNEKLDCSKMALSVAIDFMKINLNHSYKAFELLPKKDKGRLKVNQARLHFELPTEFTRQEAIAIASQLGIKERTMDDHLKVFKEKGLVEKMDKEKYIKLD